MYSLPSFSSSMPWQKVVIDRIAFQDFQHAISQDSNFTLLILVLISEIT